jgi:hypothetical protein
MELLSNDHQGPRALLDAANRLINSFEDQHQRTTAAIELAKKQHHDCQQRVGISFEFDEYVKELSQLRDGLKLALSDRPSESDTTHLLSVREITAKIKSLRSLYTSYETPKRNAEVQVSIAVEPIVARLKRRLAVSPLALRPNCEIADANQVQ